MREDETTEVGDTGQLDVQSNFSRLSWGPVPNSRRDLGTDIYVQVRDARGFDLGIFIGVQVKSGPTAFAREQHDDSGKLLGWWYYEDGVDHFEDWVRHSLPHLLVLNNNDTRASYWVHVTADKVEITGEGAKILVPVDQTVDRDHLEDLLKVAATQRSGVNFEGSAWAATAGTVPPGRRLRTALIAPRLLAPHRNKGFREALDPEEAIALLTLCRVEDLAQFAKQHRSVPSMSEAASHRDWRWRLFGALGSALLDHDHQPLADLIPKTNKWSRRAAASIAYASFLIEEEKYSEAISVLAAIKDRCEPVDHAWVLAQKGRCLAEVGQIGAARSACDDALQSLGQALTDDPTASAIKASAASLLYYTADIRNENLGETLAASDNAASWWRAQIQAWGLESSLNRTFRAELEDTSKRYGYNEAGHNRLFASLLIATFGADAGGWQYATRLLAMNVLAGRDRTEAQSAGAIDDLRRIGAADEVGIAAKYSWKWDSPDVLRSALQKVVDGEWSHVSARASLALIEHGGDMATIEQADLLSANLIGILKDPDRFAARVNPTFAIGYYVLKALAGVVGAASGATRAQVVEHVCSMEGLSGSSVEREVAAVIRRLAGEVLEQDLAGHVFEFASSLGGGALASELLELAASSYPPALEELLRRARDGDREALGSLGDVRMLSAGEAQRYVEEDHARLTQIMAEAESGSFALWNHDSAHSLAIFGGWFEGLVDWGRLADFLRHPIVAGEHKRKCCIALAHLSSRLPEEARQVLREAVPHIKDGPVEVMLGDPLGGAVVYLSAALGCYDNDRDLADQLVRMISSDSQHRADVAMMMGHLGRGDLMPLCAGLTTDADPDVRLSAFTGLAIHVAKEGDSASSFALAALGAVNETSSTSVALRIVNSFQGPSALLEGSAARSSTLEALQRHPSALVRRRALAAQAN